MTEEQKALREEVAIALSKADPDERGLPDGVAMAEFYRSLADAAIAVALERAARTCEELADKVFHPNQVITARCAAAIRALIPNGKDQ